MREKDYDKIIEDLKKAAENLEKTPMAIAFRAEEAARVLAIRQEAALKIEALAKERDAVIPRLQADIKGKEAEYRKAKIALDTATDEYSRARYNLSSENRVFDSQITKLEADLVGTADPALDAAIIFFREKLGWLRTPGRLSYIKAGSEKNIYADTKTVIEENNEPAVLSALEYCMAAIDELERMKLEPSLDTEKILDLKLGIPDIGVFTAVEAKRELNSDEPKPGLMAAIRRATDSMTSHNVEKLIDKSKKLLTPGRR
jgi:hypothetical protein